jgi:hypothetical protein
VSSVRHAIFRAVLPLTVFLGVAAFHFVWLGIFPENRQTAESCEGGCASCAAPGWLDRYVAGQHYWLGYSYAASLTFAATALRRYRERRSCSSARKLAIGGVTASGVLPGWA